MPSLDEIVRDLTGMLYDEGDACDFGVDESNLAGMIELAGVRHPDKPIRAVKDWVWWDLDITDEQKDQFTAQNLIPSIIFATHLISDSSGCFSIGWNVKTTELVVFEENCLFVTRRTVYILVGKGSRKLVELSMARSIFF